MPIVHLVDHAPPGAILALVAPLARRPNHTVVTSFAGPAHLPTTALCCLVRDQNASVVLHCTGRSAPYFAAGDEIFASAKRSFVFMHVAPSYLELTGRQATFARLRAWSTRFGTSVLTPSASVSSLFGKRDIAAEPIQLGIADVRPASDVSPKPEKIVTCCTYPDPTYRLIKGIDLFVQAVDALGLRNHALIAGFDGELQGIECKRFPPESFRQQLRHARVYVQLSRTEAYNVTAVQAKRAGVPVVVSNAEGHRDNVRHGFRVDGLDQAIETIGALWESRASLGDIAEKVARNKDDSERRETLDTFSDDLERVVYRPTVFAE